MVRNANRLLARSFVLFVLLYLYAPVLVIVLEGKDAIAVSQKMMGATFGSKAEPGTIRGDYGISNTFNLIHGSDSPESAARELGLFFKPDGRVVIGRPKRLQDPAGM